MKRIACILMAALIATSFSSCSSKEEPSEEMEKTESTAYEAEKENTDPVEEAPFIPDESNIYTLMEKMEDYTYALVFDRIFANDMQKSFDVDIKDQATRASGFLLEITSGEVFEVESVSAGNFRIVPTGSGTAECEGGVISSSELDTTCKELFGMPSDLSSLDDNFGNFTYDIVMADIDGMKPVFIYAVVETETDYRIHEKQIDVVSDGEYKAHFDFYMGYWGAYKEGISNYRMNFTFKPQKDSAYDFIITGMKLEKLDTDTNVSANEEAVGLIDEASFYGVFCYADKDFANAEAKAGSLRDAGFSAAVVLTSDWSNLSADPWYAVISGKYSSEEEANEELLVLAALGYSDAYVKYSGERR